MCQLWMTTFAAVAAMLMTSLALAREVEVVRATGATFPDAIQFDEEIRVTPDDDPAAALAEALKLKTQGRNVRVLFAPGNYTQTLGVHVNDPASDRSDDGILVIEGAGPDKTIFDGSEPFEDGWQRQGDRYFREAWPYPMKESPKTRGGYFGPLVRQEVIWVDGEPLRMVMEEAELQPGTFHIAINPETTMSEGPVTMILPGGKTLDSADVRVAARKQLLGMAGHDNVILRGIGFRWSGSGYIRPDPKTVLIRAIRNLLVENCDFSHNGGEGLSVPRFFVGSSEYPQEYPSRDITFRNCTFNHNGHTGFNVTDATNILVQNCEANFNNWRGNWVNKFRWSPGGFKYMRTTGATFLDSRFIGNYATGMWMDHHNYQTRIERCIVVDNIARGVHLEAGIGHMLVTDSIFARNRMEPDNWKHGSGVVISSCDRVVIRNNIFYDNDQAQIGFRDDYQKVSADDQDYDNNVLVSTKPSQHIYHWPEPAKAGDFYKTLATANNVVWAEDGPDGKLIAIGELPPRTGKPDMEEFISGDINVTGFQSASEGEPLYLTWSQWQQFSQNTAVDSIFADPMFRDPANLDFRLKPGSPLEGRNLPTIQVTLD